jgi:hypothetical protein
MFAPVAGTPTRLGRRLSHAPVVPEGEQPYGRSLGHQPIGFVR